MNTSMIKTASIAGLTGLVMSLIPSVASAEHLPTYKNNVDDFFYAQQTSLWIFLKVPRATILAQVGDTLNRLGFELASFENADTGVVILKPMVFTGEFGSQTAAFSGISASTEIEFTVLVRPKNKTPIQGTLAEFIAGNHPDSNIGQLRLDVLCDNEVAVAAGRAKFGEHKFLGSFEYEYPTPNSSVGAEKPFTLDMTAYTWQGAGQSDHKLFRLQADLTGLSGKRVRPSPELLFSAFPPEPSGAVPQKAVGEHRHYGASLTAYLVPESGKTLTLSFGSGLGAKPLSPVAPYGDGNPIAGSEIWPTEMRDRVQALLLPGTVAGYLLFRTPSAEYEQKPFDLF